LQPPICGEHNLIKVKPKSFKHNLHYPTTQMKSINHTKSYVSLKTWYIYVHGTCWVAFGKWNWDVIVWII
jgi:hypothetical protein